MINYFKKTPKDESLRKLSKFEKGCWIEVIDPSEKELSYLHKTFDLDKQNLISGTDKNEVPRVEFDDKDLYVILKIISPDDKTTLQQNGNMLLDDSGNKYYKKKWDLLFITNQTNRKDILRKNISNRRCRGISQTSNWRRDILFSVVWQNSSRNYMQSTI